MIQSLECYPFIGAHGSNQLLKIDFPPGFGGTIEGAFGSSDKSVRAPQLIADKSVSLLIKYLRKLVFFSDGFC